MNAIWINNECFRADSIICRDKNSNEILCPELPEEIKLPVEFDLRWSLQVSEIKSCQFMNENKWLILECVTHAETWLCITLKNIIVECAFHTLGSLISDTNRNKR